MSWLGVKHPTLFLSCGSRSQALSGCFFLGSVCAAYQLRVCTYFGKEMESVLGALQECYANMLRSQSPLSAQGGSAPSFRNTGFQVCSEVHLALERVAVTVEGSWDCLRELFGIRGLASRECARWAVGNVCPMMVWPKRPMTVGSPRKPACVTTPPGQL